MESEQGRATPARATPHMTGDPNIQLLRPLLVVLNLVSIWTRLNVESLSNHSGSEALSPSSYLYILYPAFPPPFFICESRTAGIVEGHL